MASERWTANDEGSAVLQAISLSLVFFGTGGEEFRLDPRGRKSTLEFFLRWTTATRTIKRPAGWRGVVRVREGRCGADEGRSEVAEGTADRRIPFPRWMEKGATGKGRVASSLFPQRSQFRALLFDDISRVEIEKANGSLCALFMRS